MDIFLTSYKNLLEYIDVENYKGYDPYDTLHSWIPFKKMGKWGPALAIQFQKRNPINIRPIIGVKKGYNPKGMGLLLKAYCVGYQRTKQQTYKNKAEKLFNWLIQNKSDGYSGACWGYNFDWASPGSYLLKYTPSVVVTSFVIDGIHEYYKTFGDENAKDIILSSSNYILKHIPISKFDEGISFAYTEHSKGVCYNASLLAAEILVKCFSLNNDKEYLNLAESAVDYVLSKQKDNGCWFYSFNPQNNTERKQIDFHQGFILVSLNNFLKYNNQKNPKIEKAIKSGLKYYFEQQFVSTGRSKWRLPKEYPVEIHNQAQGIITFSMLSDYAPEYLPFARKILSWTVTNMQNRKGFFYYQKFKAYTNKIPYIRWSQSWMLLAFEIFFKNRGKSKGMSK